MLGYAALRCCDRLAGALYRNIVGREMLRAFGHHVATCYMLRVVGSNLKIVKFFTQHLWRLHDVVVVLPGSCDRSVQNPVQQCCALVQLSTRNMSQHVSTGSQTRATCRVQQCCDLLRSNVAIVWPELANAG